jgi:hypothetical protein
VDADAGEREAEGGPSAVCLGLGQPDKSIATTAARDDPIASLKPESVRVNTAKDVEPPYALESKLKPDEPERPEQQQ